MGQSSKGQHGHCVDKMVKHRGLPGRDRAPGDEGFLEGVGAKRPQGDPGETKETGGENDQADGRIHVEITVWTSESKTNTSMASGFMSAFKTSSGLWLVAMLAAPLGAWGEEPPAVRVDFGYASRHVFRGVERAGQSAQAGVELAHENFTGGAWTNLPFQSDGAREIGLNAAYTWQPVAEITVKASLVHSWFNEVPGGGVKRSFEAGLTATFSAIKGFTPGLAYYHDFRLRAATAQASLARSIALTKLGAFLELNFFAGWAKGDNWRPDTPGPRRQDGYGYWGGEARVPYRIGPHSTVTAGLHYADAFGRSAANGPFGLSSRDNLWVTLGVNLDF